MNSLLFDASFLVVVPFWGLMILAPSWSGTRRVLSSPWIVAAPLLIWAVLAAPRFGALWDAVTGPSLPVLQALWADPGSVALV